MTKRHFEAIADVLASWRNGTGDRATVDGIARELAATFKSFNPAFDRERFLRACRGEA